MLSQLTNAVVLGSLYLLFALGLTLCWGVLDVLNLAHGSIFMFGAFGVYLLTREGGFDVPLPVLVLAAAAIGAVLSVLLQVLVFRPLRKRAEDSGSGELGILIASIGAGLIPVALAVQLADAEVVNLSSDVTTSTLHTWGSIRITDLQLAIVVLAIVLTTVLAVWIARSRTGRALRAIAYRPDTADLLGIPVGRLSALAMAISGALAGGSGLLLAANANAIDPHMGDGLLLKAFAVIVLGSVGSIAGAAVGAFVLAIAETGAVAYVSGDSRDIVAFGLILVVLLLRPQGLVRRAAWQRA